MRSSSSKRRVIISLESLYLLGSQEKFILPCKYEERGGEDSKIDNKQEKNPEGGGV